MEYVKNGMPEEIRDQEKSSLNYQDVIRIAYSIGNGSYFL